MRFPNLPRSPWSMYDHISIISVLEGPAWQPRQPPSLPVKRSRQQPNPSVQPMSAPSILGKRSKITTKPTKMRLAFHNPPGSQKRKKSLSTWKFQKQQKNIYIYIYIHIMYVYILKQEFQTWKRPLGKQTHLVI